MADHELAEALVRSASNTNLARVRELLARGADPNAPGKFGRTALPLAVQYAHQSGPQQM
jgi:ankyrin repeat protein